MAMAREAWPNAVNTDFFNSKVGFFLFGFISGGVYFRGGLFPWGFISLGAYFRGGVFPN